MKTQNPKPNAPRPLVAPRGFTLLELLTVVAIIALISALAVPAIKALGKSNDQIQGASLVRAMLSAARSMAISQHRMAGVAFFEESAAMSSTVHGNTTAMALFVETYDQTGISPPDTRFDYYGPARQYLPEGIRIAALLDLTTEGNVVAEDVFGATGKSRIILFDANGQLMLRGNIYFGGMRFSSYPGFFLYDKAEYDATTMDKIAWLKKYSTAVIVNGNTGGLLR